MQPLGRYRFRATAPATLADVPHIIDTSPFLTQVRYEFPDVTPDELWDVVSSARMWSWLPTVWGCRYPPGESIGVGTVRDYQMFVHHWLIFAQRERILRWEPGHRLSYTADDATLPIFGTWYEDYRVEEGRHGGSVLNWTMAVRIRFLGAIPLRWVSPVFARIFRFGLRGVRREVNMGIHAPERMIEPRHH